LGDKSTTEIVSSTKRIENLDQKINPLAVRALIVAFLANID
jgi:hypothetical protein